MTTRTKPWTVKCFNCREPLPYMCKHYLCEWCAQLAEVSRTQPIEIKPATDATSVERRKNKR